MRQSERPLQLSAMWLRLFGALGLLTVYVLSSVLAASLLGVDSPSFLSYVESELESINGCKRVKANNSCLFPPTNRSGRTF